MRRDAEPDEWQADLAPRAVPETYPGAWPETSILLAGDRHFRLHLRPHRRLGQARIVDCTDLPGEGEVTNPELPLSYALSRYNVARVDERVPVLAVGSNASPAQLRYKYTDTGVSLVMPMVRARVEGLAAGVAADIAAYGVVPATPVLGPGLTDELFVQWVDAYQLEVLDSSEGGYERVLLPIGEPSEGGVRITLPSGEVLGACYAYLHVDGCLVEPEESDGNGSGEAGEIRAGDGADRATGTSLIAEGSAAAAELVRLPDGSRPWPLPRTGDPLPDGRPGRDRQSALVESLLARSARLREVMGGDPAEWFVHTRKPGIEEKVHRIFQDEGWVRHQVIVDGQVRSRTRRSEERRSGFASSALAGGRRVIYGRALPADPPMEGAWRIVPSADDIDRRGQAIVRITPAVSEMLGDPEHVEVRPAAATPGSDIERLETIAGVVVDDDAGGTFAATALGSDRVAEVDEVLRLALGVEVGEDVVLTPVRVRHWRWLDHLVGRPFYVTCRVQLADPASAEREVCLLDPLTLELMGVGSGAEVVVEGRADDAGEAQRIRLKALAASDMVRQRREAIHGGDFGARFPSARDALGIDQEVPWVYLDSAQRALLGLGRQRLAVVRVRPSRSFQARQEMRELTVILALAILGVIEVVTHTWARIGILVGMVGIVVAAISVRLRGRMTRRMGRSRQRRRQRR